MHPFNVCIIGAGPAGMIAAVRAGEITRSVALLERNASVGRKLGLTGKGRCNITNDAPVDHFLKAFGTNASFLRNVFSRFFSAELKSFFQDRGVNFKTERQGRVFPEADSSVAVLEALKKGLAQSSVDLKSNTHVKKVTATGEAWRVELADGRHFLAKKVIIATGGASYPQTGSTGDGFRLAQGLGHAIEQIGPGLVPLETKETFVKDLMGLTLKNVAVRYHLDGKWLKTSVGEVLLTHFGVSGPLVLDYSEAVARHLIRGPVLMQIDLKPGLSFEELDVKLRKEFQEAGASLIKNFTAGLVPRRLADIVLITSQIPFEKKCHQMMSIERRRLLKALKEFPLTIKAARPLSEAMVTWGGVCIKEVDPKTMESRKAPGVYFCGEVLDLSASSGGYNLQAAFSVW
jgi:predicted Rossmann fold flavoprotein